MEDIFLFRYLMQKYKEIFKDFHVVFINLEKVYDGIPREVMQWVLEKK